MPHTHLPSYAHIRSHTLLKSQMVSLQEILSYHAQLGVTHERVLANAHALIKLLFVFNVIMVLLYTISNQMTSHILCAGQIDWVR